MHGNRCTTRNARTRSAATPCRTRSSKIDLLKEEVDKLCAPPNTYGTFERANKDGTIEINVDGKMMRVNLHPSMQVEELQGGQLLVLNEAFNVVDASGFDPRGEVVQVSELLEDGRAVVLGHADEERVITMSQPVRMSTSRWETIC